MPGPVRISLWLFIGSVLAAPVVHLFDPRPLRPFPGSSGATVLMVVSFFVVPILSLFIFIAYSAYRRQNWARWILAVLCVAALATDLPALARDLVVLPIIGVLETAVACCQSCSIVLLFIPAANRWYRSAAEADGAT